MKYLIALPLLIVTSLLIGGVFNAAQTQSYGGSNAPQYYNSQGNFSGQIYNSPSGGYSIGGAPLALNQILQGRDGAADGGRSSAYYGGYNNRPFGMDNNNYSMGLSPSEIRASRAARDRAAQQYEKENMSNLAETANIGATQQQAQQLMQQFQSPASERIYAPSTQRRIYQKRESGFETPKRVFNSIY